MQIEAYQAFIDKLKMNLQADERVKGLVLLGSTANQSHAPDEWSDHDFFVITDSDTQEHFRTVFDWLPEHGSIVLTVRETQHGLKILYESGHILEYAVFDLDEIRVAKANDYTVAFDKGGVSTMMQEIAIPKEEKSPYSAQDIQRDLGMFISLLVVGAGRVARGEAISGQVFIRTYAVGHLLSLLTHTLPASGQDKSALDNLDAYRRFEHVFPEAGAEINEALSRDPIHAALGLLDVYEKYLHHMEGFPIDGTHTVRAFLKRIQ